MRGTGTRGTAVTRSTLRQQIADALRDEVLAGRLLPGQEFTVKEIAELYGVSATPVREALVDLSAQGLLDSVQHRGFRVHEVTWDEYRSMIAARALVADGVFRQIAVDGISEAAAAGTASVRRRAEEAERAACSGDLAVLVGYDLRFWYELTALFGNPYLGDFLHRLGVQAWVCVVPYLRDAPDMRDLLWRGHGALAAAVAARDDAAARALVDSHRDHALALPSRLRA
ncbi:GntR family transcriptional regulator [Streptomyces sp. NPDC060194]|uniref:GntR family transcriptional regulator n=1 Tax=Streptomyces sp. NPDC060194 TaxID=3347069 RepID=UPI00365B8C4D